MKINWYFKRQGLENVHYKTYSIFLHGKINCMFINCISFITESTKKVKVKTSIQSSTVGTSNISLNYETVDNDFSAGHEQIQWYHVVCCASRHWFANRQFSSTYYNQLNWKVCRLLCHICFYLYNFIIPEDNQC